MTQSNDTTNQKKQVQAPAELTEFVSKLISGAVAAGSDPESCTFDQKQGILELGHSQLVVSSLYTLYTEQATADAQETFIGNVIKTATGAANMPQSLEEAAGILMPQIYGEQKIREKQANLQQAAVLPYNTLDGSERTLNSGDVAVCVVADFGHATVPVLSETLKAWDCSFSDVLKVAVDNLIAKNESLVSKPEAKASKGKGKKGKGKGKKASKSACKWEIHPSGCASTTWHDQYDSTRGGLIPHILETRENQQNMPPQGDTVCLFGANQQCLAAGALNPIGLCFMGDMCLDVSKTRDLINNQPHRLTVVPTTNSAGKFASKAADPSHPFHKLMTNGVETGSIYMWEQYQPNAQKGEFSVPEEQGEVDAVLAAVQSGKQIPVFTRKNHNHTCTPAAKAPAKINAAWVGIKEKGNGFFKKKDYKQAAAWYTKALDSFATQTPEQQQEQQDHQGALYANRSAAQLTTNAALALSDAKQAVTLRPSWPKGYFRLGKALDSLRRYQEAGEAFSRAAAASMATATSTSAKSKEAKEANRMNLLAVDAKDCAQRHAVMMGAPPKPTKSSVRKLLSEALGWADGMKKGGDGAAAVPGWMPVQVDDTAKTRLAAMSLYSMIRDRRVTERDRRSTPCSSYCYAKAAANNASSGSGSGSDGESSEKECTSPRRPAAPPAKVRGVALRELAEAGGERTMIVMVMGMVESENSKEKSKAATLACFETPLEKRSLLQLVESILEVAELKAATVQFKKLMSEDQECSKLLGDAVQINPNTKTTATAAAPTPPTKNTTSPTRRNSKKENEPFLEEKANTSTTTSTDALSEKTTTKPKVIKKKKVVKKKAANTKMSFDKSTLFAAGLGSNFGVNASAANTLKDPNAGWGIGGSVLGAGSSSSAGNNYGLGGSSQYFSSGSGRGLL